MPEISALLPPPQLIRINVIAIAQQQNVRIE